MDLSWAQLTGYLDSSSQLVSREAAIAMPWDAMVEAKSRPDKRPEFFITELPKKQMSDADYMLFTRQISPMEAFRMRAKEGQKAWKEAQGLSSEHINNAPGE